MALYRLTNKAVEDLSEIWNYTFDNWSEDQADKYYLSLINNCEEISENPGLGKSYAGIVKSIYGLKVGRHIIFYKLLSTEEVEIIRILHERMDLKYRILEK